MASVIIFRNLANKANVNHTHNYAASNHTHNYAGSTSSGGSANSAVKLDTSTAGSATQPVYFNNGKPVACTYSLEKSVPADAVFTDTNTAAGIGFKNVYEETTFTKLEDGLSYGYIMVPNGKTLLNVTLHVVEGSPAIRCIGINKNNEANLYTAWINASVNGKVALYYTYI